MSLVATEGILYYEAPVHPAVTPTWPPGHYVLGRIYVGGASPEMVGKRVVLSGSLTVQGDAETVDVSEDRCPKPLGGTSGRSAPGFSRGSGA